MGKALRTAGMVVGAAALIAITGGAALSALGAASLGATSAGMAAAIAGGVGGASLFGISAGTLLTASALMTGIGASLAKPNVGDMGKGSPVDFKADPNAGIPYAVGRTGVGGQIVRATTAGPKNHLLCYLTVHSLGPIQGVVGFRANGQALTFSADNAVQAPYHDMMWERRQLGHHTPVVFNPPAVPSGGMPEWTSAHKLTGLAAQWWALAYDKNGKTYPTGTPKPLTIVDGVLVYDPRLDSTYPGGSGPCRAGQEATYVYSENNFLHALTWALGRFQNGKRVMGLGAPVSMIDVPAFVEAANVADANGWKIGGVVYSTDRKWEVFKAMLQAGGGWPVALGAKISCGVSAPRVSLDVLTKDDAVGEVKITGAQAKRDRWNAVVPSYRSADHDYQLVPAAPILVAEWITEDRGVQRTMTPEFPLCPAVHQAAQLGVYAVANSRELGPVTIPCKPQWAGYRPNDCITVNEPDFGLVDREMVIINRHRDWATGVVTLTLISETAGKHPFALGKTGTPPRTPDLDGLDGRYIPPASPDSWEAVGTVLAGPEGSLPVIRITGAADADLISAIIVDYREQLTVGPPPTWGPWVTQEYPPSATEILITGLKPGARYQVRVRYRNTHGAEDPDQGLDLGEHNPGGIIAGGIAHLSAAEIADAVALGQQTVLNLQAAIAEANKLAETVTISALKQAPVIAALKRALHTPDGGLPLGPVAVEQKVRTDSNVLDLALIGLRNEAGTLFELSQTSLSIDGELLADRLTVLYGETATALAQIVEEASLRLSGDEAEALARTTLATTVGINQSYNLAQHTALANATTAVAEELHLLGAKNGGGTAFVFDMTKAQVSPGVTFGSRLSGIDTSLGANSTAIANEVSARTTAVSGVASSVSSLSTTVGGFSATLSTHSGVISTLQGKTEAYLDIVAAAGSDPAYLKLMADGYGSAIMLAAQTLALFNTTSGAPIKVMEIVGGQAHFSRALFVESGSRRLVMGPGFGTSSDLVLWFGPSSTALGSMTKTNGYFALATDGKVYYGTAELGSGGGGMAVTSSHAAIGAARLGTGTATTGTVTITPSGGTAPYTYRWGQAGSGALVANAPNSSSTTFTGTITAGGQVLRSQFICTVTDATGKQLTAGVFVTISETS